MGEQVEGLKDHADMRAQRMGAPLLRTTPAVTGLFIDFDIFDA